MGSKGGSGLWVAVELSSNGGGREFVSGGGWGFGLLVVLQHLHMRERQIGREKKRHRRWIKINKEIIFKWSGKKYRIIDIWCIVKWNVKIDKIAFWVTKCYIF